MTLLDTPQLDTPLKFEREVGFHSTLRERVDDYFARTRLSRRDCPRMYAKTLVILAWFATSYGLLLGWSETWISIVPLTISLGLALAAIGFNIQHDGGHHAYSDSPTVNRWMALSLDMMGGSSYVWAKKHNSIHHTFANITGHDDDIDIGALGRLSPHQPRRAFHCFQHFYLWFLYGLLPVKWQFYDDFRDCLNGRIGNSPHRLARPRGWDLTTLLLGKAAFFLVALVLPILLHPAWAVVLVYLGVSFVQGLTMSIVFQLAHCVEEAEFPVPIEGTARMESAWAAHQVETTVDFAHGNRLVGWFTGGLNFQIEHHLFPQVCHLHYPAIAPLVEATCDEFGIVYRTHPTFRGALTSHYRWLRRMGEAPSPAG